VVYHPAPLSPPSLFSLLKVSRLNSQTRVCRAGADKSPNCAFSTTIADRRNTLPLFESAHCYPFNDSLAAVDAESTPSQTDTADTAASNDAAGAKSQVPAAPSNASGDSLLLTAGGSVTETAEGDDGGCFEPFIPQVSLPPATKSVPQPKPPSFMPMIDKILRDCGFDFTPTDTTPETAPPAPAPPRVVTAGELVTWIKRCLLAKTHLAGDVAELVAF